ncbi:MAG: ChbG/HpnK family deacetylase, partial [Chloroflexota bacterium]
VEKEFRAQIEMGLKRVPHASHISHHMALDFVNFDERIGRLSRALGKEYGLDIQLTEHGVSYFDAYQRGGSESFEEREETFIQSLRNLKPGKYCFIDHPALDNAEMRAIKHRGYEHVAQDRYSCFRVFTSKRVLAMVEEIGIELLSYKEIIATVESGTA